MSLVSKENQMSEYYFEHFKKMYKLFSFMIAILKINVGKNVKQYFF